MRSSGALTAALIVAQTVASSFLDVRGDAQNSGFIVLDALTNGLVSSEQLDLLRTGIPCTGNTNSTADCFGNYVNSSGVPDSTGLDNDKITVPLEASSLISAVLRAPAIGEIIPLELIPPDSAQREQIPGLAAPLAPFAPSSPPPRPDSPSVPSAPPSNAITRTIFDTATITQTITLPPVPTPTPTVTWIPPADFENLDCFGILKYGFGKSNLKVVHGIPASASAASASGAVPTGKLPWTNGESAIEAFYPRGSINPGNAPQGGADFYARPLEALENAQNVTFGYSVFLPVDFEPVRGGKLPGLYGGKTGCSGGDAALDCFSTRLMWRAGGEGELYLYAPKDKQTKQVCTTPPRSICEADYGLSIGRGSFKFTPGRWTHVSQTVVLNTPGRQDGYFSLDVDGSRVIDLHGVYYRQTVDSSSVLSVEDTLSAKSGRFRVWLAPDPRVRQRATVTVLARTTETRYVTVQPTPSAINLAAQAKKRVPGFSGIFFSTFFGGHSREFATPKDQKVWFKDFELVVND